MKFQVFKDGKIVDKFALYGAYLFGTDGIAIRRAQIKFKDGIVNCKKSNMEASALALLWPIKGFGKVLLPTTCLPDRTPPYILNVEIARAKLMQIVSKQEDWSFFEEIKEFEKIYSQAQQLFIKAVQNISDPPTAAKLADEALEKAMIISEKMAMKQSETLFSARGRHHGFGRGCLGCKADPERITEPEYVERLLELFGFITIPVNWGQIESVKGHYDFSVIDKCVNVLSKKRPVLGAGPLLCFSKEYLPKWLLESKAGFEQIRDTAYRFVSNIVSRYSSNIRAWRVVSCLNCLNYFGFNFEQVLEMTRAANMAVKASSDRSLKIVEIGNLWGEYYATTPSTIPPLVYVDMVIQSGINFEAFGLPMQFGKNQAGMHVRDMMQISSILDNFLLVGKPLCITEVEVPSQCGSGVYDEHISGIWHGQWNQMRQKQWVEQFYKIALSKPFVDVVTYSALADTKNNVALTNSGLLTEQLEPKASFEALKKLRELIFTR